MKSEGDIERAIYLLRRCLKGEGHRDAEGLLVNSIDIMRWMLEHPDTAMGKFLEGAERIVAKERKPH